MSGVPMPETSRVAVPEGGKFAGMRRIVVSNPVFLEHLPELLATAQQLEAAAGQGDLVVARASGCSRCLRHGLWRGRESSSRGRGA